MDDESTGDVNAIVQNLGEQVKNMAINNAVLVGRIKTLSDLIENLRSQIAFLEGERDAGPVEGASPPNE